MNETMRFFKSKTDRVNRVINKITRKLLEDEHLVIHPTVVTKDLIDSFHRNNPETKVLEISSIFRITKDIPASDVLYFIVVFKRYGRTFKPKKFYLLDNTMAYLNEFDITDSLTHIAAYVALDVSRIL